MLVKNIIKLACTYLQLNDLLELSELGGTKPLNANTEKELNLLLQCVNLTNNIIATEYVKLYKTAKVKSDDGVINFTNIAPSKINSIHSVKNNYGNTLVYKTFDNHIKTAAGEVFVKYSYIPDSVELNDVLSSYKTKINERVFAYGVASEYSFIKSIYDDAAMWENRFKSSLMLTSKKTGLKIPKRRWL